RWRRSRSRRPQTEPGVGPGARTPPAGRPPAGGPEVRAAGPEPARRPPVGTPGPLLDKPGSRPRGSQSDWLRESDAAGAGGPRVLSVGRSQTEKITTAEQQE